MTKRNNYEEDDLYSTELDLLADESRDAQIASYKSVKIDETATTLKNNAIKYIKNIVSIFHKIDKRVDDFHISELEKTAQDKEFDSVIESIAEIESMNLVMLLKQVKWGDHLVETLMRRLESGGNMDSELINQIISAQASSLNLTLTISSYVRNIPTYFKHLKNELKDGNQQNDMLSLDDSGMLKLDQVSQNNSPFDDSVSSEFDITKPQRGMKDLISRVNAAKAEATAAGIQDAVIDFEDIKK